MILVKIALRWLFITLFRMIGPIAPPRVIYGMARAGAFLYYHMSPRSRAKITKGLESLLKDEGEERDFKRILKLTYFNFIASEFEVFLYPRMSPANIDSFVKVEGLEGVDRALAKGKGAVILHPHFGNAHLLMPGLGHRGYKVNQVGLLPTEAVHKLEKIINRKPDPALIEWFNLKDEYERTLPAKFIYMGKSVRPAIECLGRNELLAISIDGESGDMMAVKFLGLTAHFLSGPLRIAARTGAPVIPAFTIRQNDGSTLLRLEEPMDISDNLEKEMCSIIKVVEEYVRKRPCQYARLLEFDTPPFSEPK